MRPINPYWPTAMSMFDAIVAEVRKNIIQAFDKISVVKTDVDDQRHKQITIKKDSMAKIVVPLLNKTIKKDEYSEGFIIAAKAVNCYFNQHLGVCLEVDGIETEELSHSKDLARWWFKAHHLPSLVVYFNSFAEKLITLPTDRQSLCCYDYALSLVGEERLSEFVEGVDLDALLLKWGYISVEKPQIGDLVLFLKDGKQSHLGVYRKDGLIESKWGNDVPCAFLHTMENTPYFYGDQVLFFRPPS